MSETRAAEEQVLILAPAGRDAAPARETLAQAGIDSRICIGAEQLAKASQGGAGALLLTQEAVTPSAVSHLREMLTAQPAWSDLPIVLLVDPGQSAAISRYCESSLGETANVILVERPAQAPTLVSAVRSALRARRRQYEARELHHELSRSTAGLRASEERYKTLVESIDEGFCVVEVLFDASGKANDYRFLEVNPAFEVQTGLRNAMGRHMRELVPELEEHWFETFGRIALTGVPERFENEAKALNRWYEVYAFRLGGDNSRTVAVLFDDITGRRQVEEDRERLLREANRQVVQMEALLNSMQGAVTIVDATGHIVLRNPAQKALSGVPDEEATCINGYTATRLLYSDGTPVAPEDWPVARLLKGEDYVDEEYWLERRDGTRRRVLTSGSVIRNEDGQMELGIIIARDVTILHEMAERREDFLRMISHDLRQPLTVIQGHAQLLRYSLRRPDGIERAEHGLDVIGANARRMGTMIFDLVESSRLEYGADLHKEPTNLSLLLSDIVERTIPADERGRIDLELPDWTPSVMGDQARLERAVVNLISNALRYSPADTPITLRLTTQENEVVVSVIDRGVGIASEDLPNLFQRYSRAGTGGKRGEGLGLGLYISRLIVEAHGGRIWVESKMGEGSTFSFSLPVAT